MVTGSSGVVLLATKVLVSAGCVLAGATAAVRLGPRLGGPVASVRQLAVVSLVFFMIEPGPAFASQTAFWEHPGDVRDSPVFLGYLAATRMVPTPRPTSICAGVGLGAASFVLAAAVFGAIPLIRGLVVRFAAAVCGGAGWLVRGLPDRARFKRMLISGVRLATRAAASALTVAMVTSLAEWLGPKWSGLVIGFPVNSLPVMVILHAHYGRDAIRLFVTSFRRVPRQSRRVAGPGSPGTRPDDRAGVRRRCPLPRDRGQAAPAAIAWAA